MTPFSTLMIFVEMTSDYLRLRRLDVKNGDLTKNDSLICWRIQIVVQNFFFFTVKSKEFNNLKKQG